MRIQSVGNYEVSKNNTKGVIIRPTSYMAKANAKNSCDNISFGAKVPIEAWRLPKISLRNNELIGEIENLITKKVSKLSPEKQAKALNASNKNAYIPDVILSAKTTDGSTIELFRQECLGFPDCHLKVTNVKERKGTSVVLHTSKNMTVEKYPVTQDGEPTIWTLSGRQEYKKSEEVDEINTEIQGYLDSLIAQNKEIEKKPRIITNLLKNVFPSRKNKPVYS